MQNRFTMFRRGAVFYCEDRTTGQQKSLLTRDEAEARKVIQAKNEAVKLPQMNLVMAKTLLVRARPEDDYPDMGGCDGAFLQPQQ